MMTHLTTRTPNGFKSFQYLDQGATMPKNLASLLLYVYSMWVVVSQPCPTYTALSAASLNLEEVGIHTQHTYNTHNTHTTRIQRTHNIQTTEHYQHTPPNTQTTQRTPNRQQTTTLDTLHITHNPYQTTHTISIFIEKKVYIYIYIYLYTFFLSCI